MKCKACDAEYTPHDIEMEGVHPTDSIVVIYVEECCPVCVGAAFNSTYEANGIPYEDEFLSNLGLSKDFFTFS